jgi:hypothetical protein
MHRFKIERNALGGRNAQIDTRPQSIISPTGKGKRLEAYRQRAISALPACMTSFMTSCRFLSRNR